MYEPVKNESGILKISSLVGLASAAIKTSAPVTYEEFLN